MTLFTYTSFISEKSQKGIFFCWLTVNKLDDIQINNEMNQIELKL